MSLRVRSRYLHSPEMAEVARILHVTPGLSEHRIKSALSEEVNRSLPSPKVVDTFYQNLRRPTGRSFAPSSPLETTPAILWHGGCLTRSRRRSDLSTFVKTRGTTVAREIVR